MNNFSDVGRVGKDAVTRHTQSGEPVTGFSLAIDSGFGDKKQTHWFDCSLWGKRGESVAPYLLKGAQVFVQGEFGTRDHEGKQYLTLRVSEIKLIGSKGDGPAKPTATGNTSRSRPAPVDNVGRGDDLPDDDIPFVTNRGTF